MLCSSHSCFDANIQSQPYVDLAAKDKARAEDEKAAYDVC